MRQERASALARLFISLLAFCTRPHARIRWLHPHSGSVCLPALLARVWHVRANGFRLSHRCTLSLHHCRWLWMGGRHRTEIHDQAADQIGTARASNMRRRARLVDTRRIIAL